MPSISKFISQFDTTDLARPCNFKVTINPPRVLGSFVNPANFLNDVDSINTLRKIEFVCESAELPARTFSLVDQKTYGPIEQYPIQNAFNKTTLNFICSDDMLEKKFMDQWMESICTSNPTGKYNGDILLEEGGVRFDFEYKVNYISEIHIDQYDLNGEISYRASLRDAFPVEVHSMPLNWGNTNDYHRVTATFAYRYAYSTSDKTYLNNL